MSKLSLIPVLLKPLVLYLNFLLWQQLGSQLEWQATAAASSAPPKPLLSLLPEDEVKTLRTVRDKLGLKPAPSIYDDYCYNSVSNYGISIGCDCQSNEYTGCRITKILMSNLGLTSVVPEELGELRYLKSLQLSQNKLHGPIPAGLGNLNHLETLDLSQNQLNGSIPDWTNLQKLRWLYLQFNFLEDNIPPSLGSLVNLEQLYLHNNRLSGFIPDLGNLSRLTSLSISENQLTGSLPESLGSLSYLSYFWAASNFLTREFPKSYEKLTSLKVFSISGNNISGPLPVDIIKSWTNITAVFLLGNNFRGDLTQEVFNHLLNLPNLQYLQLSDLENANLELPPRTDNLEKATYISLVLRNCGISGPIPKYIGQMASLKHLDLSFNKLTGPLPEDMESELVYMSFSTNRLSGTIPAWIHQAVQTRIDLSFNNFSALEYSGVSKNPDLNLFACCHSSVDTEPDRWDLSTMMNTYCQGQEKKYHSLFINCGGGQTTVNGVTYEEDNKTAPFFTSPKKNWAYTSSGDFGSLENANSIDSIRNMTCGAAVDDAPLYDRARLSPVSLKYYGFCLREGNYTVTLKFAEVVYTEDTDYTSLRKREFDVYIQNNMKVLQDFNIREQAGGPNKPFAKNFTAVVNKNNSLLTIHMYWDGKGSVEGQQPFNGPLISAISVTPEFKIHDEKLLPWHISLIVICPTIAALLLILLLAFARKEWLRRKYSTKIKVGEGIHVTLKELIDATGKFNVKNIIGSGSLGTVYKAELQGAHPQGQSKTVAVKKLSSNFKENIQKLQKEIILLHELSHENVIKMFDFHIEKDHQLLVYEFMANGPLDNCFNGDSITRSRNYTWVDRVNICLGIAKGLKYLHEQNKVTIIAHMNIKPVNILLDAQFEPKITDFGLSHLLVEVDQLKVMKKVIEQGYMPPEYFQQKLTKKTDVYSFGVILFEIVSWRKNVTKSNNDIEILAIKAIEKNEKGDLMAMIDRTLDSVDQKQALTILQLALKCTNRVPHMRPDMSDVVSVLEGQKEIAELGSSAPDVGEENKGSGDVSSAPAIVEEKNWGSGYVASSLGATSMGLSPSPSNASASPRGR